MSPPLPDFDTLDLWIRTGKLAMAQAYLREQRPPSPQSPPDLLRFASLCRRAGIPMRAIVALRPWVRPGARRKSGRGEPSPPAARVEYAASLLRLGAHREAELWLSGVDPQTSAEVPLFRAFAKFARWDYADALPDLRSYCQDSRVQAYPLLVGRVNLASALTLSGQETFAEAEQTCLEALALAEAGNHLLLVANLWVILAQLRIFQGRLQEAKNIIHQEGFRKFAAPGPEGLLFRKWAAVLDHEQHGAAGASLHPLSLEARAAGAWEIARDCDFHEARISRSRALQAQLYWGSPYPSYRRRIEQLGFRPEGDFWDRPGAVTRLELDTTLGKIRNRSPQELRPGSLGLKLLQTLASDAYRPWSLIELHENLYPGQHFDPESTPDRIHQLIRRVRVCLRGSACQIHQVRARHEARYELNTSLTQGGRVRVGQEHPLAGEDSRIRAMLRPLQTAQPYSLSEICSLTGLTPRTASRQLQAAETRGEVSRIGRTRGSRFVKN